MVYVSVTNQPFIWTSDYRLILLRKSIWGGGDLVLWWLKGVMSGGYGRTSSTPSW